MSRLFSARKRSKQWIAALVLVTGWLAPIAVPHAYDDDLACVAGPARDDQTPRLNASSAQQKPDHCLVCHAARSFRSAQPDTGRVAVRHSPELFVEAPADGVRRTAAYDRLPARAPPAHTRILVHDC